MPVISLDERQAHSVIVAAKAVRIEENKLFANILIF